MTLAAVLLALAVTPAWPQIAPRPVRAASNTAVPPTVPNPVRAMKIAPQTRVTAAMSASPASEAINSFARQSLVSCALQGKAWLLMH